MKRIKNYNQWFLKWWFIYFEYSTYNHGVGFNIDFRVKQDSIFNPGLYFTFQLSFIGTFDLLINHKNE